MNEILEILNRLNKEFPIGNGRNHCVIKKPEDDYLTVYFWVAGETWQKDSSHFVNMDGYEGIDKLFEGLHSYVENLKNDSKNP